MKSIGVIQFPYQGKQLRDALGKERIGWCIVEDGQPGYPYPTKEQAIANAWGVISIRAARIDSFLVISSDGTKEKVSR
jgi:hypothetical protein